MSFQGVDFKVRVSCWIRGNVTDTRRDKKHTNVLIVGTLYFDFLVFDKTTADESIWPPLNTVLYGEHN